MTRSLLAYKEACDVNLKLKIYHLQRLNQGVILISNDWDFIISLSRGGGGDNKEASKYTVYIVSIWDDWQL